MMANKHMKRHSTSLVMRDMQIKITMRYHFMTTRMTIIINQKITSVDKDVDKLEPLYTWWECKMVQSLWKTVWRFLKNLNIELPYDPAILLLGVYLKRIENRYSN